MASTLTRGSLIACIKDKKNFVKCELNTNEEEKSDFVTKLSKRNTQKPITLQIRKTNSKSCFLSTNNLSPFATADAKKGYSTTLSDSLITTYAFVGFPFTFTDTSQTNVSKVLPIRREITITRYYWDYLVPTCPILHIVEASVSKVSSKIDVNENRQIPLQMALEYPSIVALDGVYNWRNKWEPITLRQIFLNRIQNDDTEWLETYVKNKGDVNMIVNVSDMWTAMHYVAYYRHYPAYSYSRYKNLYPNEENQLKILRKAKILLRAKADIYAVNTTLETPLHKAIEGGQMKLVELIINMTNNNVHEFERVSGTPLFVSLFKLIEANQFDKNKNTNKKEIAEIEKISKRLIDAKANLNFTGFDEVFFLTEGCFTRQKPYASLLQHAISYSSDLLLNLIVKYADLNAKVCRGKAPNRRKMTPLQYACVEGKPNWKGPEDEKKYSCVQILLENKANPNIYCGPESIVTECAVRNDYGRVQLLIQAGADVKEGYLLPQVCASGNLDLAKLLLSMDCNIDCVGERGRTPLMQALMNKREEMVDLLLTTNANPNIPDSFGFGPLHVCAAMGGLKPLADSLRSHGAQDFPNGDDGFTALMISIWKSDDYRRTDKDGVSIHVNHREPHYLNTALHMACARDHSEAIKSLIELGADVTMPNRFGELAWHICCQENSINGIKALAEAKYYKDHDKWNEPVQDKTASSSQAATITPLYIAAQRGSYRIVKYLLEESEQVRKIFREKYFPLFAALREKEMDIVAYMFQYVMDLKDCVNESGETFMMVACKHLETPQWMNAVQGSNYKCVNYSSIDPLQIASTYRQPKLISFLLDETSPFSTCDFSTVHQQSGKTALFYLLENITTQLNIGRDEHAVALGSILSLMVKRMGPSAFMHVDNEGNNMFHYAARINPPIFTYSLLCFMNQCCDGNEIAEILKKQNKMNQTAQDVARYYGHKQVLVLLDLDVKDFKPAAYKLFGLSFNDEDEKAECITFTVMNTSVPNRKFFNNYKSIRMPMDNFVATKRYEKESSKKRIKVVAKSKSSRSKSPCNCVNCSAERAAEAFAGMIGIRQLYNGLLGGGLYSSDDDDDYY